MTKKVIATKNAPGAVGPYSQGISVDDLVFTSGQIPLNMATGEIERDDIKAATKYALDNVKAILEEAGSSMENIVKVTVFLDDMANFPLVNEVYATYFTAAPPARSCVAVKELPLGIHIEIEAIATK